jgi:hypothetical protein
LESVQRRGLVNNDGGWDQTEAEFQHDGCPGLDFETWDHPSRALIWGVALRMYPAMHHLLPDGIPIPINPVARLL